MFTMQTHCASKKWKVDRGQNHDMTKNGFKKCGAPEKTIKPGAK